MELHGLSGWERGTSQVVGCSGSGSSGCGRVIEARTMLASVPVAISTSALAFPRPRILRVILTRSCSFSPVVSRSITIKLLLRMAWRNAARSPLSVTQVTLSGSKVSPGGKASFKVSPQLGGVGGVSADCTTHKAQETGWKSSRSLSVTTGRAGAGLIGMAWCPGQWTPPGREG